jgi:hypothetical protein
LWIKEGHRDVYRTSCDADRGRTENMEEDMPILLWLLGVPIPVIIILLLLWH